MQDDGASAIAGDITFTAEEELAAYRAMLLIRRFEEKAGQLFALGAIHGLCPLSIGQEASVAGVMMAASPGDQVITGSRNHGHMLALGIEPARIMAELMGKKTGLSGGMGGSIRMFAKEKNFFGGHAIPGTAATLGSGLAFASKYRKSGTVCLCFFGDGTASKGRVHETFELASEWKLPMVFVIENAVAPGSGIALGKVPSALAELGAAFAIPGEQIDGIDVRRTRKAGWHAMERARRGDGPTILEMLTFSYRGHGLPGSDRTGSAEKRREDTDPIFKSRNRMLEDGVAGEAEIKGIEKEIRDLVNRAAASAKAASAPAAAELARAVTP